MVNAEIYAATGKIEVGTIIYLEKVVPMKISPKDVKFESFAPFGDEILEFYEAKDV